jgi:hypothetical protein
MKRSSLVQLSLWLAVLLFVLACLSTSAPPNYSVPLCTTTNNIALPLNGDICSKANNPITISSTDSKAHTCTFQGSSKITLSIQQGKSASDATNISAGDYTLSCDNVPKSVKVTVSAQ